MATLRERLLTTRGGRRVFGLGLALFGAVLIVLAGTLVARTGSVPRLLLGVGPFAVGFGLGVAVAPGRMQPDGTFALGWLPLALGAAAVVAGVFGVLGT